MPRRGAVHSRSRAAPSGPPPGQGGPVSGDPLDDLALLGLGPAEALVLAAVARHGWTTTARLAGATGLGRPQLSTALAVLEECGLVDREHGKRPQPVRLADRLESSVALLLEAATAERDATVSRAEGAAARLRQAAAAMEHRPAPPARTVEPPAFGPAWGLASGRTSVDVVERADDPLIVIGGSLGKRWRRERLIVVCNPDPACVADRLARGTQVRTTPQDLPRLAVVDDVCARVDVVAQGTGVGAWTWDPPQVAAACRLFALWWDEAG